MEEQVFLQRKNYFADYTIRDARSRNSQEEIANAKCAICDKPIAEHSKEELTKCVISAVMF